LRPTVPSSPCEKPRTRRTSRQSDVNDLAFPIRVKIALPRDGLGRVLEDMARWLREELCPSEYAEGPGRTYGGDAHAVYFRRVEDAARFLAAFPGVQLSDATRALGRA
jgi:hypothetical protein